MFWQSQIHYSTRTFFILATSSFTFLSSCDQKEFTETPIEVQNSCDTHNIESQWRGELSYTRTETYIDVHWKKIVQDWTCVKAMEFFVDEVKDRGIWGRQNENVRINKIGEFSLKVEVYFLIRGNSADTCHGVPGWQCKCFEATINLKVHEGNEDNEGNGGNGGDGGNDTGISTSPFEVAVASGGVILLLALLLTLTICCIKLRRRERRRLEKAEEEEMTANTDVCNVYGVYATSNEETDYSLVIDTNPDYAS